MGSSSKVDHKEAQSTVLVGHGLLYTATRCISGALAIALTAILTRLFNPEEYGFYGLILVAAAIVQNVGFDWLGISFQRFFGSLGTIAVLGGVLARIFAACMLISAGLAFVAWIGLGAQDSLAPVLLLGLFVGWAFSLFELVAKVQVAEFRPFRYMAMNLGRAVLALLGATAGALLTRDPAWAAVGVGLGACLSLLFGSIQANAGVWFQFDRSIAREMYRFGIPLVASIALMSVITAATRVLIEVLDSREALGLYTAAFIPIQSSLTILAAGIHTVGFQLAVRAVESGNALQERQQLLSNGTLLLAIIAPASVGAILVADDLARVLVGPSFHEHVALLIPWLAGGSFFASVRAYFFDYSFQLSGRPNAQAWVTAIAACVAIMLSFLLIPGEGAVGAAKAFAGAMCVSCCLAGLVGRQVYAIPIPVWAAARILCCCMVMSAAVISIPGHGPVALILKIAAGVGTYVLSILLLNILGLRSLLFSWLGRRSG